MGTITYEISELVETFDKHRDKIRRPSEYNAGSMRNWMRVSHISEVSEMIANGWTEGIDDMLDMIDDMLETVDAEVEMPTWHNVQDVSGAEVNIADFLAGEPECMLDSVPTVARQQGKVITLVCPHGASAAFGPSDFAARGRYYVALVTLLQRAGFSVDLWIDNSCTTQSNSKGYRQTARIHLMAPGDVLDIQNLNFWLAHPSSTRAVGFALRRNDPDAYVQGICDRPYSGGYGYTSPANPSDYDDGALILDGSMSHGERSVVARMREDLAKLGIETTN